MATKETFELNSEFYVTVTRNQFGKTFDPPILEIQKYSDSGKRIVLVIHGNEVKTLKYGEPGCEKEIKI